MATQTSYHTKTVNDVEVFYREAGPVGAPVLMMLHGFPSSSHQFRNVIPQLAKDLRVIAPDLPGFGSTVAPARGKYDYTFDALETHGNEVAERIRSFLGDVTRAAA